MEIISKKLPESYKMYLTRHNDEVKLNAQKLKLAQAFKSKTIELESKTGKNGAGDSTRLAQALLSILSEALVWTKTWNLIRKHSVGASSIDALTRGYESQAQRADDCRGGVLIPTYTHITNKPTRRAESSSVL